MGEIDSLPPASRIPPVPPATGSGKGQQAPKRKPAVGDRDAERQRRRKRDDDDAAHIDEYV